MMTLVRDVIWCAPFGIVATVLPFAAHAGVALAGAIGVYIAAESELKLPKPVTGFVLPLAAAIFKLAGPSAWISGALFVNRFYSTPLHAPQLAFVAAASVFMGFGLPGIPRGSCILSAPPLLAVGLPVEGVGILIAVDAIGDTFATVLNATGNLAATVLVGRRVG